MSMEADCWWPYHLQYIAAVCVCGLVGVWDIHTSMHELRCQ